MAFDEWVDLYRIRENYFHKLNPSLHTIIFMDGRGVTGNHLRYNLFERDPIYRIMSDCAWNVADKLNLNCRIYSAADECSVIFPDTKQLIERFEMDDCGDYIATLYLQHFLKFFWVKYPEILIKSTIFQHTSQDAGRYLEYRKAVCWHNALWWQAKEYLRKEEYTSIGDDTQEMIKLLKRHQIYDELIRNNDFYNGVEDVKNLVSLETESF